MEVLRPIDYESAHAARSPSKQRVYDPVCPGEQDRLPRVPWSGPQAEYESSGCGHTDGREELGYRWSVELGMFSVKVALRFDAILRGEASGGFATATA